MKEDLLGNQCKKHHSKEKLKEALVEGLYGKLSKETGQTSEVFHFEYFEIRNGKLYHIDKSTSLTIRGEN